MEPVTIEIQKGTKPYIGRYCSISKSMEEPLKKEIHRICQEVLLEKLSYDDDSPWKSLPLSSLRRQETLESSLTSKRWAKQLGENHSPFQGLVKPFRDWSASYLLQYWTCHRDTIQSLYSESTRRSAEPYLPGGKMPKRGSQWEWLVHQVDSNQSWWT